MLPLDPHTKLTTQVVRDENTGELRVEIHSRSDAGSWTRHAVRQGPGRRAPAPPARLTAASGTAPRCRRRTSTPRCGAPVPITGTRSPR